MLLSSPAELWLSSMLGLLGLDTTLSFFSCSSLSSFTSSVTCNRKAVYWNISHPSIDTNCGNSPWKKSPSKCLSYNQQQSYVFDFIPKSHSSDIRLGCCLYFCDLNQTSVRSLTLLLFKTQHLSAVLLDYSSMFEREYGIQWNASHAQPYSANSHPFGEDQV